MRQVTITRAVGKFNPGQKTELGNKSALYLVEHGYAEYDKSEKNLPKVARVQKGKRRVDALGTDDLSGGRDES